jgi:hypothetical protein
MKFKIRNIFYLLFFFSCVKNRDLDFPFQFEEIDSRQINLDDKTSTVESFIQYVPDWKGNEAIAFHVRDINTLKLYSINSGDLIENLKYETQGPNSFQGIYDFHILNEDSLFLNKRYLYKTYLVNQNFELLHEIDFLPKDVELNPVTKIPLGGDSFLPVYSHNRIFKKFKNKIFITGSPDENPRSKEYFDTNSLIISYDFDSQQIEKLFGYQEKMKGKAWGSMHSRVYATFYEEINKFFISFEAEEKLFVTDENLKVIDQFDAFPEKDYSAVKPISEGIINSDKAYLKHFRSQFQFGSVLIDTKKNILYRVALKPNSQMEETFLNDPLQNPRSIVVMAFDLKTYRKLAEINLYSNDEIVFLDRCFINSDGLNIAFVDLKNEDKLYFKVFTLF